MAGRRSIDCLLFKYVCPFLISSFSCFHRLVAYLFCLQYSLFLILAGALFHSIQEGKLPSSVPRFLRSGCGFDRIGLFSIIIVATSPRGSRQPLETNSAKENFNACKKCICCCWQPLQCRFVVRIKLATCLRMLCPRGERLATARQTCRSCQCCAVAAPPARRRPPGCCRQYRQDMKANTGRYRQI